MLITGGSQQSPAWIAENGDGWMTYPRNIAAQEQTIAAWREKISASGVADKPVYATSVSRFSRKSGSSPKPIHLGFRTGMNHLRSYLLSLNAIGVNHVALNLRFNHADIETTLHRWPIVYSATSTAEIFNINMLDM